jgi:hypothetical protein
LSLTANIQSFAHRVTLTWISGGASLRNLIALLGRFWNT